MIDSLKEWLKANRIRHEFLDDEVLDILGLGKMFVEDTDNLPSIFRATPDGVIEFNSTESPEVLAAEGIDKAAFRFGNNWYWTDLSGPVRLNILKYVGEAEPPVRKERFVNLGCHTGFELLNGSGVPMDWVRKAKWLGHDSLGVCERNTMASHFQFQCDCGEEGLRHVFGYSLTFVDEKGEKVDGKVYVQTQRGLKNLLRIQKCINVDHEEGTDTKDRTIAFRDLVKYAEGNVFVFGRLSSPWMAAHKDTVEWLFYNFENVYYQVDLSEYLAERFDRPVLEATRLYFSEESGLYDLVPPVLLCDAYYLDKEDFGNKTILNKVATGAAHEASEDQWFKTVDDHYEAFRAIFDSGNWDVDDLFAECCEATCEIADGAEALYHTDKNFMPQYDMTEEEKERYGTPHNMFNRLLEEGLQRLVPEERREEYRKQMEYEKYVIESTNNVDYLLVQWDTVNWCRRNDILVGCGRGSAAGSLLLYLLGITLVDPLKYGLIFERFLLPERAGMYPAMTTKVRTQRRPSHAVRLTMEDGRVLDISEGSVLTVRREGHEEPVQVAGDQLRKGDDIIFDNRDEIFTLNEI